MLRAAAVAAAAAAPGPPRWTRLGPGPTAPSAPSRRGRGRRDEPGAAGPEDAEGQSRRRIVAPSPGGGCRLAPAAAGGPARLRRAGRAEAGPPRMSAGCGRDPPRKRARPSTASPGGGSQRERSPSPPLGPRQEGPGGGSSGGGSPAIAVGNKGLYRPGLRPPRGRGSGRASAGAGRGRGFAGVRVAAALVRPPVPRLRRFRGAGGRAGSARKAWAVLNLPEPGRSAARRRPRGRDGAAGAAAAPGARREEAAGPGAPPSWGVLLCPLLRLCCASLGVIRREGGQR